MDVEEVDWHEAVLNAAAVVAMSRARVFMEARS